MDPFARLHTCLRLDVLKDVARPLHIHEYSPRQKGHSRLAAVHDRRRNPASGCGDSRPVGDDLAISLLHHSATHLCGVLFIVFQNNF